MDINSLMKSNDMFTIQVLGLKIPISDSIIMMWIIMIIVIVLSYIFTKNLKTIPEGKQNFAEIIVDFINNLIKNNIGHHWKSFSAYFGTIFMFLVFANTVSIFSLIPTGEELYKITGIKFFENLPHFAIVPPTKDLNVTIAMALMTVILVFLSGIKFKGIGGWLKSFIRPTPTMLPFHILDYGTRTISLSLRLFGNIFAGFVIIEMLYGGSLFVKPIIPLASAFFDIFDGLLQAYIFVFLSSIYISEAIE